MKVYEVRLCLVYYADYKGAETVCRRRRVPSLKAGGCAGLAHIFYAKDTDAIFCFENFCQSRLETRRVTKVGKTGVISLADCLSVLFHHDCRYAFPFSSNYRGRIFDIFGFRAKDSF